MMPSHKHPRSKLPFSLEVRGLVPARVLSKGTRRCIGRFALSAVLSVFSVHGPIAPSPTMNISSDLRTRCASRSMNGAPRVTLF